MDTGPLSPNKPGLERGEGRYQLSHESGDDVDAVLDDIVDKVLDGIVDKVLDGLPIDDSENSTENVRQEQQTLGDTGPAVHTKDLATKDLASGLETQQHTDSMPTEIPLWNIADAVDQASCEGVDTPKCSMEDGSKQGDSGGGMPTTGSPGIRAPCSSFGRNEAAWGNRCAASSSDLLLLQVHVCTLRSCSTQCFNVQSASPDTQNQLPTENFCSAGWATTSRSTLSRSQMRSRLLTATQREAEARMEAQLLAVDATDMHDQLQHMTAALITEQYRSSTLEKLLAVRYSFYNTSSQLACV
jgi:hypothetical protein